MATIQINHLCFLMLLVLFAFTVTKAFPDEEVRKLCKETTSEAFCFDSLEADPRIVAARDLGDVLVIAISLSNIQVGDATTYMKSIRGQYTDPVGIKRMNECETDYRIANSYFNKAWESALNKRYEATKRLATISENAIIKCENVWRIGGPLQTSPFTEYNTNVSKLYGIICVLLRKLGQSNDFLMP